MSTELPKTSEEAVALQPVVSCGECKHWRKIREESRRIDDEITWPGPHGECNLHDEFSTDKKAWTYSREADDAALITQPDFGCINGEAAMTPPESHPSTKTQAALHARSRALTTWDKKVLRAITTTKPGGVANWTILQNEYGAGGEISRSLQKLKRRGLAVIVSKRRGDTWWRATQRQNDKLTHE